MSAGRLALALALVAALLGACEDLSRPVDPVWGKQACAHCAMLVSDPRFAAELTTTAGDRLFFDDPGCMAAYVDEHRTPVRRMWVHDVSGAWIDAQGAQFKAGASSPMDYGFATDPQGKDDWSAVERAATSRMAGGER